MTERLTWTAPSGWQLEITPLPDRVHKYLVVIAPDGMVAAAQFLDERSVRLVGALLDEFTGTSHEASP